MSGFSNPLTGQNGSLIYPQVKSPNFNLVGKTGWAILKNGNAYFFNVTATGVITATEFDGTDFVINQNGAFFYNGTPATGNLILALAPSAGSDAFGNGYSAGLSAGASGSAEQIVLGVESGSPLLFFLSAIATAFNNAALMLNVSGAGTAAHDTLVIKSSQDNAHKAYVAVNLNGNSNDGTTQLTSLNDAYVDSSGAVHTYRDLDYSGNDSVGTLVGVEPGTGLSDSNTAVAETWHTASLNAAAFQTGGDQAPRYRFEGLGGGVVRLDGTAYSVGAEAVGTTIFTLPAEYRPTVNRRRFVGLTNAGGYAAGGTVIMVNTSGTVTNGAASTAANQQFCMDGITFPVD